MRMSAFIALPSLARESCIAMEKPRLGMNGNGCAGSIASGVSSGKTWVRKRSSSQARSAFLRSPASSSTTPAACKRRSQRQPLPLLIAGKLRHRFDDAGKLLVRRQPVRTLFSDALAHLALEAGDAHHEEFVEVIGRDGEKAHPLEHRMVLVGGLFQHPAIKVQPGQFTVDETLRLRPQRRLGGGLPARRNRRFPSISAIACPRSAISNPRLGAARLSPSKKIWLSP